MNLKRKLRILIKRRILIDSYKTAQHSYKKNQKETRKAIQRINGIIIKMSKAEITKAASNSPYRISADEINRVFSCSKIKR